MTVKELIEKLTTLDGKLEVFVAEGSDCKPVKRAGTSYVRFGKELHKGSSESDLAVVLR
jgi:hypothetical protein